VLASQTLSHEHKPLWEERAVRQVLGHPADQMAIARENRPAKTTGNASRGKKTLPIGGGHRHGYDNQAVDASEDAVRSREIGRIALHAFKYDATAVLETAP